MVSNRLILTTVLLATAIFATAVDVNRTFVLLKEGEQLTASEAADLEAKLNRKPKDL